MSDATLTEKTTITYNDILAPGDFVTGVRQASGANNPVVLTGNHPDPTTGNPQALIYQGPLFPTSDEGYAFLTPVFFGQTVTTSTFYGPNTPLFNPGMGKNNIRAVGSYKYAEASDPQADHGMMYEGALDGSGAWTVLDVPKEVAGGVVFSTIPPSTMGDLVVGNDLHEAQPRAAHDRLRHLAERRGWQRRLHHRRRLSGAGGDQCRLHARL